MIFFSQRISGCAALVDKSNYVTTQTFIFSTSARAACTAVKKPLPLSMPESASKAPNTFYFRVQHFLLAAGRSEFFLCLRSEAI